MQEKNNNNKLNLFIGPLGKARQNAINFVAGLQQAQLLMELIDKLDTVDDLLKNGKLSESEKLVAQSIKDDLEGSLLEIAETAGDVDYGQVKEKPIF